jgi:hypothetical protein
MSILLSNYNTSNATADINGDGTVNVLDLSILLSNYGKSVGGNGVVLGMNSNSGDTMGNLTSDFKRATLFNLNSGGTVNDMTAWLDGLGGAAGSQSVRYGIFNVDSSGNPTTLIAQTGTTSINSGQVAQWITLNFSSTVTLTAGQYYLAIQTGPTENVARLGYSGTGTSPYGPSDTFSDGLDNTWGTRTGTNNSQYSIYTNVTTNVSNPPPAPPGGSVFPIAVWFQSPNDAAAYAAIGINTYVMIDSSLVTPSYMSMLKSAGIKLSVPSGGQAAALTLADQSMIAGWVLPDEPDNAQGPDYVNCVDPSSIQNMYNQFKAADPQKRPVLIDVGQALGDPNAPDRGSTCSSPTRRYGDYPLYFKASDIASNDVYPVNHYGPTINPDGHHPLTYVSDAMDRERQYARAGEPTWQDLETTKIQPQGGNLAADAYWTGLAPTTAQVRCEMWLSITHGATGLNFFAHSIVPFVANQLLNEPTMGSMIKTEAGRIQSLSGAILSGTTVTGGSVLSGTRVDWMEKTYNGHTYVFATTPYGGGTVTFTIPGIGNLTANVLNESRTRTVTGGVFNDSFNQYDVHLYQLN